MPSSTPSKLIKKIRDGERILGGILFHDFVAFKERFGYDEKLEINPFTVEAVVKSFVDDLEKYSQYHGNIDPDVYKQSAYWMFWISRLKPIPLSLGSHAETNKCRHPCLRRDEYGFANEILAIVVGLGKIGIDFSQLGADYHKITKELIYQLYYREINPKQLYITLELLHRNISGNSGAQKKALQNILSAP
ncbi:MAG: hypothetical protein LBQ86_07180 [Holophagales bacterium]|jgi:hypothetical protein|nr:hypothetical protein [Holophagales bacterium]